MSFVGKNMKRRREKGGGECKVKQKGKKKEDRKKENGN
jgi:hypothetical protein